MSDPRADEVRAAIQSILCDDWDPIGCGVPRDEYDAYIPAIYLLLRAGWGADQMEQHLRSIEVDRMGLSPRGARTRNAALNLVALDLSPRDRTDPQNAL